MEARQKIGVKAAAWMRRHPLAATLALCALLYVPMAGSYGLWDPWETHYGEVSRSIVQRDDPISPFWQDKWFWSKPILTFWLGSSAMRIAGLNRVGAPESEMALSHAPEWALRLPIILMSLIGLWGIFIMVRRLFSTRAAVFSVLVTATSPMYAMITRQAITDIPFLGPLTASIALLMIGIFSEGDAEPEEFSWLRPWMLVPTLLAVMLLVWPTQDSRSLLFVSAPFGIAEILLGLGAVWLFVKKGAGRARVAYWGLLVLQAILGLVGYFVWGPPTGVWTVGMLGALAFGGWELVRGSRIRVTAWHLFGVVLVVASWSQFFLFGNLIGWRWHYIIRLGGGFRINLYGWAYMLPWIALWVYYVASTLVEADRSLRSLAIHGAWFLSAVAVLAKGLGGIFLPMAVVGLYILVTRSFALLGRLDLAKGLALWFAVAAPWHHAMWIRHRNGFWSEYFIHHHFKRLEMGVHGERGTIEYFVHQLGFGMFPWIGLVPAALLRWIVTPARGTTRQRAGVFVAIWAVLSLALFGIMETKFHHYILPAIPPLSILVGIWLDEALDRKDVGVVLAGLFALGVALLVGRDLLRDPEHLVVMFIYKYDRLFPYELHFEPGIVVITILSILGLMTLLWSKTRKYAGWALGVASVAVAIWAIDYYMIRVSPHWSQKQLHATYYRYRKGPEERIIAWQLNWRGENFYTKNHVVVHMEPKKTQEFKDYLRRYEGWTFYIILERGRYKTLKGTLPTERARRTLEIVGPDGKAWPDEWVKHFRAKRFSVLKKPYMNDKFLLVRTTI